MTRHILTILILLSSLTTFGQSFEDFKKDFEKALDKKLSEKELNEMFSTHSAFLTPHSDVTQLTANIKGQRIGLFPLADFKGDKLYTDNIEKLVNSKNSNQRILAYLVIAGSGDTSFENTLLQKIKEEKDKGCLVWAGMALLYLNTNHTTPLFDFLVENETFGDAHMLPLFIKLNKDSLQQTAYSRINSDKPMAKILAAQILSNTQLNAKTEELLKKAVKDWDINIKGYAIYSVAQLQIGNLLETFKPLLDSSQTRRISLEALANSPTDKDRQYLYDLVNKQDTVSKELLDCFYKSKSIDNLKYWLKLLYTKPIPAKYIFFVFKQPLIRRDTILPDVQFALQKIKNAEVLGELVRALEARTDDKSVGILLSLLTHENSTVRYWTAWALKGNHSPKLIIKLPELIKNPITREVSLTELAIENKLDTLQSIYYNIYLTDQNQDWKRSSIEYLSNFPVEKYREIFRKILQDKTEDFFVKQNAALGLGRLKDENSTDLIICVCREKATKESDFNARVFLVALSMIKTDKAKNEIEKYKASKEQVVRELVADILKEW